MIQCFAAAAALLAGAAVPMPWHEVRDSHLGEALGCAFLPDCHMPPSPPLAVRLAAPPDAVHSGLDHGGWWILGALVLQAAALALAWRRPRLWLGLVVGFGAVGLAIALFLSDFMPHLFDHTTDLAGAVVRDVAMIALAAAGVVGVPAAIVLHFAQRAADAEAVRPHARSSGSATST